MQDIKTTGRKLQSYLIYFSEMIPELLLKLFLSWLAVSVCTIFRSDVKFTEKAFYEGKSLRELILWILLCWICLLPVKKQKWIAVATIVAAVLYSLLAVHAHTDFLFSAGCCAAVAIIIFCSKYIEFPADIPKSAKIIICSLLGIGFTVFVSGICCLYYQNYWTSCYDFGIFSQMFYYMKTTGLPLTTCERDELLNHFAVHFSPAYYFILPIYALLPDPRTLLVMQPLIVASGIIPLVLLCKKHKLSNLSATAFSLIYILYTGFSGGCFGYLHENCFLAPLLLWLIWSFEQKKIILQFLFALSVLAIKEDAAVYVAVVALYYLFDAKMWKTTLPVLVTTVVWFVVVTHRIDTGGDGLMTGRYNNLIYKDDGGLLTVIAATIQNPVFVIQQCFSEEKIIFMLELLLPLGFLPLLTNRPARWILLIPFVLVNLMTGYAFQYNSDFQYCFGSGVLLIYMAILNYSDLQKKRNVKKLLLTASCFSMIIWFGLYSHRADYPESYRSQTARREAIRAAIALIPENAVVASCCYFQPNLSQRDFVYQLETTNQTAEYYIVDLRVQTEQYSLEQFQTDQYEQLYLEDGVVGLFRNTRYHETATEG